MSIKEIVNGEVTKILQSVDFLKDKNIEETLEKPPQEEFGDIATNICFSLAKELKKPPQQIAQDVAKKIKIPKDSIVTNTEAKGGYVNFFFNYPKLFDLSLETILKENKKFGLSKIGNKKKIMVEFSAPNPAHPIHIGTSRTTFLGDAINNILEFNDYKVIRANYINDVGLQIAKLVTAYRLWGKGKSPDKKPDVWLWDYYVKFHEEMKKDPKIEEKAREILREYESGSDKETSKLWNKVIKWCVDGFKETYKNTGVKFDVYFIEHEHRNLGKKIVEEALKRGIVFKSPEGTYVADLEKHGLSNCVVLRSDGTGLYSTSDLGLTVNKFEKYKLDKSVWVVSSEQNLYFKQLFKIFELLDYPWYKDCIHVSFELVRLQEGKMSSREGRAIMLDQVIEELTKLANEEVEKRNPKLPKKKKQQTAKAIALGALRYTVLKIEPNNTITFDWEQMLSFEGNTGPYIQYAHTRCNSIFAKASKWKEVHSAKSINGSERKLIKKIVEFPEIVKKSGADFKPHFVCNYLFELANTFNEFYHTSPVLRAETKELRNFRLTLVKATQITLKNGLSLLGIETPEVM